MSHYGLGRWGQYLEAELTGLQIVTVHALTSGSIDEPTIWIRGRAAAPTLHLTTEVVRATVDAAWMPGTVFYWREIPSLQFVTARGSVIVTDLWGDTQYRTLRGAKARSALALDAPLIRAASRVEMLCAKDTTSPVLVTLVGTQIVEPLRPRAWLRAWSSCAADDRDAGLVCQWIPEENQYKRAGIRAVVREFHLAKVNV